MQGDSQPSGGGSCSGPCILAPRAAGARHAHARHTEGGIRMRLQHCLLSVAGGAGLIAIAAGLVGFKRLAGGAAAVLLVIFLLIPWMNQEEQ